MTSLDAYLLTHPSDTLEQSHTSADRLRDELARCRSERAELAAALRLLASRSQGLMHTDDDGRDRARRRLEDAAREAYRVLVKTDGGLVW